MKYSLKKTLFENKIEVVYETEGGVFMYHSKKIALFISHIFGDYQRNVCQGVVDQAAEYGFKTEIYATSSDGEDLGQYGSGESSILRIPNFEDFSGIVVASGTYPAQELKDQIIDLIKKECTCPIVEIADTSTCFPSIVLENNLTTGTLTEHLISVHNYRRICYLGCKTDPYFSPKRAQAYQSVMIQHGYTVGDHDMFDAPITEEGIREAFEFFCNGSDRVPEAVVCYNDKMALLFMVIAIRKGYKIPEDIALVGCDALPEGQNITSPLTTVSFPTYQLGTTAVRQLFQLMHGTAIPDCTSVFAEPVIGGSCGCRTGSHSNYVLYGHQLLNHIQSLERSIYISMRMSADLSHATDIDDGMDLIAEYVKEISGCTQFYLCLYSDWDSLSGHILELTDAEEEAVPDNDTILLKLAIRDGKRLPEYTFPKKTLLPDIVNKDSSSAYIVSSLFFEDREFGYIAIAYEHNQIDYQFQMVHWIMNITQLLQNLCEIKSSRLMQSKLESIYMKDALTGLYNRHGYERKLPLLLYSLKEGAPLTAFLFDMDCLKVINDQFGHTEGDFALKVIGKAIMNVTGELPAFADAIGTRFGGDEFYVLCSCGDEDARELITRVNKYLHNYNQLSSKPYLLSVSAGYASVPYQEDQTFNSIKDLINQADENMYEFKKNKTKKVIREA